MLEGLLYRDETIKMTTAGQAGIDVDDYYSFVRDDILLNDIYFTVQHMPCEQRIKYLTDYKIPTDDGSRPIYFIEAVDYLRYQLDFDVMIAAKGGVVFGLTGTTSIDGGYDYSGQQFTVSEGQAVSIGSAVYPTPMGSSVLFRQSVNSLGQTQPAGNVYVKFKVKRVIGIDPLHFLGDCKFPPLPNPNDSPQAIINPNDGIRWWEELKMSLPPAETKQPLANNSLPLNILRFLK